NGGSPVTFQAYPASGRVASFATLTGLVPSNNGTATASATYNNLIAPITVTVTFSGGSPPQSYTVTFNANANAGVSGTMSPQSSSTATALTLNAYSRVGYTFSGWNTNATGTGTSYGNGAQYPFTSNITLYAVWAQIPVYNVTFDPNGGVAGSGGQTGLGYAGVTIPINPDYTPTRAGFTFTGYWTLPSGGSQVVAPNGNYTFTLPNQTLYAQWSANPVYTITWNGNGGTPAITTSQGTINSVVASPTPTLAGSTFIGWYSQQSGGSLIVSPGAPYTIVSGNNTLYAQWALSQCPSPQNYSPIVNGPNLAALDILGVQYPIGVFNGNQGAGLMNGNITFYNLRAVLPGITLATSANQWQTLSNSGTPACAWYNYTDPSGSGNPDECAEGLYYNWYALSVIDSWLTTNRPGNRVPTSCDYKHIFNALASTNISGMQGCTSPTTFNALGVTIGATFPDNCANSAPNNGTLGKALGGAM
ncbi:MAG: InlB B-repeat-containing protein, partial [Dolichospermum sp.]